MELKMLKDNSIWIRSEDNEIYLVGCDSKGDLYAQQTQPRLSCVNQSNQSKDKHIEAFDRISKKMIE